MYTTHTFKFCLSLHMSISSSFEPLDIRELSICMTDDFYDGKASNVAFSPQWLSGPLCGVELGRLMDDKFDACEYE